MCKKLPYIKKDLCTRKKEYGMVMIGFYIRFFKVHWQRQRFTDTLSLPGSRLIANLTVFFVWREVINPHWDCFPSIYLGNAIAAYTFKRFPKIAQGIMIKLGGIAKR